MLCPGNLHLAMQASVTPSVRLEIMIRRKGYSGISTGRHETP